MDFVVPGVISIRIGVYQETFAAKQHEHQARHVVIEGLGPTWSYTRTFLTRNLKSAQHTPIILSPVTLNPRLFHLSSGALATDALVASTSPAEVPEASRMPCCTSVCLIFVGFGFPASVSGLWGLRLGFREVLRLQHVVMLVVEVVATAFVVVVVIVVAVVGVVAVAARRTRSRSRSRSSRSGRIRRRRGIVV